MMKKYVICLPAGDNSPLSVSGLTTIINLARHKGLPIEFTVCSENPDKAIFLDGFSHKQIHEIQSDERIDLILIPAIVNDPDLVILENRGMISWLTHKYNNHSEIASMCTGAYLLAATGLLNGLEASSHCAAIPDLKKRFPQVLWKAEKIISDSAGLYTSGGTLSSFNLLIYILSKHFDRRIAIEISKFLQIDYPRPSQKPFFILSNQKNHKDQQILDVQNYLENHFGKENNFDNIARKFALSRRSLNRRFKQATGDNPQMYLHRIRVEKAKGWLETAQYSISEIADMVGYKDGNSFRQLFKKMTGHLPSEYKRKFLTSI